MSQERKMGWFERWLSQQDMTCVAGKSPSPDKAKCFCRQAENGEGCPNLTPRQALVMKPRTVFGKRRIPRVGVNVC